jgi:hypothetical protein
MFFVLTRTKKRKRKEKNMIGVGKIEEGKKCSSMIGESESYPIKYDSRYNGSTD